MNAELPAILARIRQDTNTPLAVGFGVATRDHFNTVSDAGAEGVVVGSRLIYVIKEAPKGQINDHVEAFCREITGKDQPPHLRSIPASSDCGSPAVFVSRDDHSPSATVLPSRFGEFGGQYAPESLMDALLAVEAAHVKAMADPEFKKELESYLGGYVNRPSQLYLAEGLTRKAGGARIWLKREDL